jgi:hypothetical protein
MLVCQRSKLGEFHSLTVAGQLLKYLVVIPFSGNRFSCMGQIFYDPCTCPVLILASFVQNVIDDYLGLVQVGRSGLVLGSCILKTILVSSTGEVNLYLVPGFEIVLVLLILILE